MKFDTHIHTHYSPCSNMDPREVVDRAVDMELDEIVIKDHNEIDGGIKAREHALKCYRDLIKVNLGIEFSTQFGEFGASFLTEREAEEFMNMRRFDGTFVFSRLVDKIREIREGSQSEILVDLHHPFDFANPKRGFNFQRAADLGLFYSKSDLVRFFDFTEFNTASTSVRETMAAIQLADDCGISIVCSTDSHFLKQIGSYYTETNNNSAREAILSNKDLKHSVSPEDVKYFRSRMYRILSWSLREYRKATGKFPPA